MWVRTPSQPFRHTRQASYATSPSKKWRLSRQSGRMFLQMGCCPLLKSKILRETNFQKTVRNGKMNFRGVCLKSRKCRKYPKNHPKEQRKRSQNCRRFSFLAANYEQTVNERNFQNFHQKSKKCEKMKIIFTFHHWRAGSHKIF